MKKLITLCLALAGMVGTVSAENVTRRIFVITDTNFQQFNSGNLAIHAWYTDGSGDVYSNSSDEKMATIANYDPSDKKGLWMKDITFDGSKTIKFYVYDSGNTGWHSSDSSQKELSSTSDMTYYSWDSNSNGDLTNNGSVSYYAYLYDGSSWSQQALTCNDYYAYTATIDNQTSYNSALEIIIAPSIAFLEDFSSAKWDFMYRPNQENQTVGFSVQNNYGGGSWASNSNSLKLNASAHYDLTFYPYGWTYSITPYIESTVTSANVATFSSEYAVAIPDGLTASYVTGVGDNNVLNTVNFSNGIPASTGALLIPSSTLSTTTTYQFTPATSTDEVNGNKLVACTTSTPISQKDVDGDKYNYILTTQTVNGNADPKFYLVNGTDGNTVSAGRAYLQLDKAAGARQYFSIWASDANSIDALEQEQTADGQAYNLAGQRIAQPTKGLYIVNGKKFIKK